MWDRVDKRGVGQTSSKERETRVRILLLFFLLICIILFGKSDVGGGYVGGWTNTIKKWSPCAQTRDVHCASPHEDHGPWMMFASEKGLFQLVLKILPFIFLISIVNEVKNPCLKHT